MPTLDWLNRADAFTTAAKVQFKQPVLEQASLFNWALMARDGLSFSQQLDKLLA
jgi:hypothetical protein